jgi:hypothetical protein
MSEPSRTSPVLPLVALAIGVWGDLLLTWPLGLGAALAAGGCVVAFVRLNRASLDPGRSLAAAAALTAAAGLAWRDSSVLATLDLAVLAAALGLLATGPTAVRASLAGLTARAARSAGYVLGGAPLVVGGLPWAHLRSGRFWRLAFAVLRGLLVAGPVVLVFAVLLANADAVFALRMRELIAIDLLSLGRHVLVAAALSWFAAGLLGAGSSRPGTLPERPSWLTTGAIEVAVVLGLVDLLFGGFVWVQLRYLFGGHDWVETVAGLTYSQYARHGFFELVAVTVLALPLLLFAHWIVRPSARGRRVVLALAGAQVALVMVMLSSALERMRLYQDAYGQTELRFYTTAFMLWLAALLVAFLLTVLPGRRDLFAHAVLLSAWAALAVLHAVNPDERIVAANRDAPNGFDLPYALTLSDDALPALVDAWPQLDRSGRATMIEALRTRALSRGDDLRSWNASRSALRATYRALEISDPSLGDLTLHPVTP